MENLYGIRKGIENDNKFKAYFKEFSKLISFTNLICIHLLCLIDWFFFSFLLLFNALVVLNSKQL